VAFLGGEKGVEVICLDDQTIGRSGGGRSGVWPISLSGDGTTVAYRLASMQSQEQKYWVVFHGGESPSFDYAGLPTLSRNGRVIAYKATRNEDEHFIRIGEKEEPACDWVTDPAVSADGSIVAYAGSRRGRSFLKVNDKETPISGKPNSVFLSPDGRKVGWVELVEIPEGGSKMRVVAFNTTGKSHGLVGRPMISPTEDIVTYGCDEGQAKFVVIGTRKVETPDRISDPVFSPDGRKVGYGARIGRELWWKVLDVGTNR